MAADKMDKRVLLTGANGFLGLHLLSQLLHRGYSVRCVVRSQNKADLIISDFPDYTSQLDFTIVPDMTVPGAFDTAVQSSNPAISTVFHQASPFLFASIEKNSDFLDPAIQGTTNLLQAVHKFAPDVKRVIYTSSCAAIIDRDADPVQNPRKVYTEADWNPMSYEDAVNGQKGDAYRASKKFAEEAAWKFVEKNQGFDLVSINPPMIFGPFLPQTAKRLKIEDLNESNKRVYEGYLTPGSEAALPHNALNVYVDVRDLATAHVQALETEGAGGQRIIVSTREISAQRICDILRENLAELKTRTPIGKPGTSDIPEGSYQVSNEKCVKILGLKFKSDEECFLQLAQQLLDIEKK